MVVQSVADSGLARIAGYRVAGHDSTVRIVFDLLVCSSLPEKLVGRLQWIQTCLG